MRGTSSLIDYATVIVIRTRPKQNGRRSRICSDNY